MSTAIASRLELHLLRPDILPPQMHKAITDAMHASLAAAVVGPVWVSRIAAQLRGSGVSVVAAVGYPLGINKPTLKAIEATSCIKDGATEIEVVPWIVNLMREDADATRSELLEIVRAARATSREVRVRVVIDAARLQRQGERGEAAIESACVAVRQSGCDAVVTGTSADATPALVAMVKQYAAALAVKAVGSVKDVLALVEAGADRVGAEDA